MNYSFFLIKSADIGYITFLYMLTAYIFAIYLDLAFVQLFGLDDNLKTKNQLIFEIFAQVSVSGIISYIGRNIIMEIPSPLHGIDKFDHYRVKELNSGAVLLMFLIIFQKQLQKKIVILREMK